MIPNHMTPGVRIVGMAITGVTLFLIGCQSSPAPPTGSSDAGGVDISPGRGVPVADSALSRPAPSLFEVIAGFLDGTVAPGPMPPGDSIDRDPTDPVAGELLAGVEPDGTASDDGRIQSGTLTAGSFDDYINFESYYEFASSASNPYPAQVAPDILLGDVIAIHVADIAGEPIGNARVVVSVDDVQSQSQPLIDIPTRSDGRTLFLTAMDGADDATDFTVTVYPPDGSDAVAIPTHLDDPVWEIVLPSTASELPTQLDLAFVVDATGSMGDELEYLKVEMENIVASVSDRFPDVDQHYALVVYRDEGDDYITRTFDFTSSLDEFQIDLSNQRASGGGDYPEAMHDALEEAVGLSWREANTTRVLFLIADAPPHERYAEQTLDAVKGLRRAGVAIYPVAASGVAEEAEFVMRTAALMTLSEYCFITDDSGVGNPHAEPNIACYVVERLDQLIIRMIAGELTGGRIYADPENIIRVAGNPVDGKCLDVPQFEQ